MFERQPEINSVEITFSWSFCLVVGLALILLIMAFSPGCSPKGIPSDDPELIILIKKASAWDHLTKRLDENKSDPEYNRLDLVGVLNLIENARRQSGLPVRKSK